MIRLNPAYVLAPLDALLAHSHHNVMLGLRIVERVETLPPPTPEEVQFLQLSFGGLPPDFAVMRDLFRKWVLLNGFEDVYKAIRLTLERLFVFKSIQATIPAGIAIVELERELRAKASKLHYPQLIDLLTPLLNAPFKYREHVASYNAARNCLEHTNGVLTERHCNNTEKNKLIIRGNRFKLFFKKGVGVCRHRSPKPDASVWWPICTSFRPPSVRNVRTIRTTESRSVRSRAWAVATLVDRTGVVAARM